MTDDHIEYESERELAFLLVDAGRKLNDAYDMSMKPLSLTRSQWRVMAYVSRTPGISQTELANSLECSRMAVTSLIDRMESKGLVERRAVDNDRRMRSILLTKTGKALVKKMNKTAVQVLENIFTGTTQRELQQLRRLLETIKFNATELAAAATSRKPHSEAAVRQ
jgi:MarR family transcriptional regulator for hemolysin